MQRDRFWMAWPLVAIVAAGCDPQSEAESTEARPGGKADDEQVGLEPRVLLLHGYHSQARRTGNAWNCADYFGNQREMLAAAGATEAALTVGFYTTDRECDILLDDARYTRDFAGDVTAEQGAADSFLTRDTPLEHVAYRFAWMLADEHAADPARPLRVITDSIGGMVVRWAVKESSRGNPNYPALEQLGLDMVVMAGSPHQGVPLVQIGTWWGVQQAFAGGQALQMLPDSPFIQSLIADPRVGHAEWVSFTSRFNSWPAPGDGFISNTSACWFKSTCYRFVNPAYMHGRYLLDDESEIRDEAFEVGSPDAWSEPVDGPGAAMLAAELVLQ